MRSFVVCLVLLAVAGCGATSKVGPATMAPTVDVTGKWTGTWVATNPAFGSGTIEMTLKQTGSEYDGNLLIRGTLTDPSSYTRGVVSGNEIRVLQPSSVTGSLTVQGDSMTGGIQGVMHIAVTPAKPGVAANVMLKRQK